MINDNFKIFNNNFSLYEKEEEDFNKKYKNSVISKIKLFLGFYNRELREHKKKLNRFCEDTSRNYSLTTLRAKFSLLLNNFEPTSLKEVYLKNVLKCSFKPIEEREDSVGFTWKITNKKTNVVHYVVGTSHAATKNMTKNPSINMAVENTKLLITELKGSRILLFLRKVERAWTGSSIKHAIDDELIKLAWKRKNKTLGIETFMDQAKLTTKHPLGTSLSDISLIVKRTLFNSQITNHASAEFWQNGNEDEFPLNDVPPALLKNRNIRWLKSVSFTDCEGKKFKGLIELLNKTNTPTCIAVGAAHCFGNAATHGLIHAFKQEGLEVERIGNLL